jgi:hypothetical protein
MAKQNINVGTTANDKKGDSLRAAFQKVNANFTELYTALGLDTAPLNLGAFEFTGSILSTTDSSSIIIDQDTTVTSNLSVGGDILPQTAVGGDLGSSTLPWRSLYVSNNTIYIGGTAVGVDANGALTTGGTVVGSTPAWASITGKPTFAAVATGGTLNADTLRTAPLHIESTSYLDISSGGSGAGHIDINALSGDLTLLSSDDVIIRSGNDSWTFIGGANPFVTFPAITGGDQLQIQGAEVSTIAGNLALTSVTDINIISNGSGLAPGGSKTWTFGDNGSLTLPGDIHSEGNINISINLDDSTTRTWQFGEDGSLTLPSVGKINNDNYEWTFGADGKLTLAGELDVGGQIYTSSGILWQNGQGAGINYNSADNIFVIAGNMLGVTQYWKFHDNGRTTFPNGTVPEHSYGAAGDKEGMVVFTDPYIYYCKQDYVNNTTDIWVRVAWTGTSW